MGGALRAALRRAAVLASVSLAMVATVPGASAQDLRYTLPQHHPLNPMTTSRSGLYAQPYMPAAPGWRHSIAVEYGSSAEWEEAVSGARYVLDAELMRVQLVLSRDLSATRFVQIGTSVNGVFDGFADPLINWYHSRIGISSRGREQRPDNRFRYSILVPRYGLNVQRERPDQYLGDLQLGYGVRHSATNQTVLLVSAPTSTAPAGYTKNTYSLAAVHTMRGSLSNRLRWEATLGGGYTPTEGELANHQFSGYNSTSLAATYKLFGDWTFYTQAFTHSALYRVTGLPELESRTWAGDFDLLGRTPGGREWRVGFTEDFGPSDGGIDIIVTFSTIW
jgi:hypothetical protein